ncbi:MAG: secondary thiamine-phosphate synthase enzyme YjbQ [Candidatus Omnitrophota bacterium]
MIHKISVATRARSEFIDITAKIDSAVRNSKISSGFCFVYVPHTTAAVTVNENADASVRADIIKALDRAIPIEAGYRHSEGNSAAHVKSSIVGSGITLIVEEGSLVLGAWQGVYFCEFDGPRQRTVLIKVTETKP